jgi:hypothetical protein
MSKIEIVKYTPELKEKWDQFVLNESINGTILQTQNFLEYHHKRFKDNSLLFINSGNISAVCPATISALDGKCVLLSHPGSTFGGLIISKNCNNIDDLNDIIDAFDNYCPSNNITEAQLKQTGDLFSSKSSNLIDYLFFLKGYGSYEELSFAILFKNNEDVVKNFKSKTRNLYKKSLKYGLTFKEVTSPEDIQNFHKILCVSLLKYNTKPVHTFEEMIDLQKRLLSNIRFYGVFNNNEMIAGSMVFLINGVFHTQYLAANPNFLYMQPMDFLDANLILEAAKEGFKGFSFGISTEQKGKVLNTSLAKYKEGFGMDYFINKTYFKKYIF